MVGSQCVKAISAQMSRCVWMHPATGENFISIHITWSTRSSRNLYNLVKVIGFQNPSGTKGVNHWYLLFFTKKFFVQIFNIRYLCYSWKISNYCKFYRLKLIICTIIKYLLIGDHWLIVRCEIL